jgi:N-acetylmuramoyl-L-alanine amidase CwlA
MKVIKQKLAHITNYRKNRLQPIEYIVIHYTANNGDTSLNNANYFANNKKLQSSAHYFVDENEIYQSVLDSDTAWHCGTTGAYKHPKCRNHNAIGIELCSRKDSMGNYYFDDKTVENAIKITLYLMDKYNIPVDKVIRHFDVTGKNCPAPFVKDESKWMVFKNRIIKEVIDVALEQWMIDGGRTALKYLEKQGLILNAPDWGKEEKLGSGTPQYLTWMMLQRLDEKIEGKTKK